MTYPEVGEEVTWDGDAWTVVEIGPSGDLLLTLILDPRDPDPGGAVNVWVAPECIRRKGTA